MVQHSPASGYAPLPTWRGRIHFLAVPLVIISGIVLITQTRGFTAAWASGVFVASALLLFGVSAVYHRSAQGSAARAILRVADHANIFILIAGTYTPLALLALRSPESWVLITAVWVGAGAGVLFRVLWMRAPRWLYVAAYVALGWAAIAYSPGMVRGHAWTMLLILLGGLVYTAGAICYALKRPDPLPTAFGYHEIFHTCTVIAYALHWTAIWLLVQQP